MDIDKTNNNKQVIQSLFAVIQKSFGIFKRAQYFGTNTLLYFSEIHLIEVIGKHDNTHITEFAKLLGVTKGAISQTAMKLEKKGLIKKKSDPKNHSRFLLELTKMGEKAFQHHKKFHMSIENILNDVIDLFSLEGKKTIRDFIVNLNAKLDKK